MNHQQTQTRAMLDAIVADTTAPEALRDDLRHALAMFDTTVELDRQATDDRRRSEAAVRETRRTEPRRILELLRAGEKITVDDLLPDLDLLIAAEQITSARAHAARRVTHGAWAYADKGVIQPHADAVLRWVAAARAAEPWSTPIADHLVDAWHAVAGTFTWQLPAVAPEHRFHTLRLERHTEAMRRTWAAVHAGDVALVDDKPGRKTYRVNAYWDDLLPE